ncbi:hypothetical protein [Oryza sativa Japonica Group]|jgi:phosphatidylserine decarboxylase|nr:hypothetical protein [Oryza sativa Japonica Group]
MGHSPSRHNACGGGGGDGESPPSPLPSRFERFRRRLRLRHRDRAGRPGGDAHASESGTGRAIAVDEFAGIARIRIVKADMQFKDKFIACLSLGERTYRTEKSDKLSIFFI